ncbi:MAG: type VI secretion system-associated FHA domain protein TagH [Vicinamibacterales bacterium]
MTLTLELTASSAARPGDALQRTFDEQGGTIGRAATNSWVLTHNKVSGHHAGITFRNGVFYIEDRSRNGVSVNSMDNRLVRGRPYALKTGDRIFMEPYEIGVWIEGEPAAASASSLDPFAEGDPFAAPGSGWPVAASREVPAQGDVVDPLLLIPGGAPAPRKGTPPPVPTDDLLAQHYQPPQVVPTAAPEPPAVVPAIPAGYNPLDDAFSEPVRPPAAAPRAPSPQPRASAPPVAAPPTPAGPPPPVLSTPPVAPPSIQQTAPPPAAPMPPLADDPFADPTPDAAGAAPGGPVPVAPLDLDALTGPPPVDAPAAMPARPRPGMDAQARRRPKEPVLDDSQTVRFPVSAIPGLSPAPISAPEPATAAPSAPVTDPAAAAESPSPAAPSAGAPPPAAFPSMSSGRPAAEPTGVPASIAAPAASAAPASIAARASIAAPVAPAPIAAPAAPVAPPAPAAAAPSAAVGDLSALLAGAGLPGGTVTPELSRDIGRILRVVVEGLMDVLQSRQRIKEEFGMQQTAFRPAENNPLKFSANLEDALHNLFVRQNPAYLGSVDAFREAFDDLRDHQLAVLAGLRVAFDAMLGEFDPGHLQERFDAQIGKSALPLVPAKMRYWDMFRTLRADLAKDPEATFERLFGEEFRRAYEEQFRDLKAQRRARAGRSDADPAPRS